MTCAHQSPRDAVGYHCAIGRYGGKPHALACEKCMIEGRHHQAAITQPPLLNQAANLGSSLVKWAGSGFAKADAETLEKRMSTCKACDLWDAAGMAGTGRCRKCGCSTQAKLRMASEKCPIGKW